MINRNAILLWSEHAPWIDNAQIEQDLVICRALIAIFSDEFLASQLAFRGGTALHKPQTYGWWSVLSLIVLPPPSV